ncbi:hypothetical protein [Methylobacterium sp. WSM2598]|nr:hypothetical protein [Methylobacterium sp. WSM2598]
MRAAVVIAGWALGLAAGAAQAQVNTDDLVPCVPEGEVRVMP